jgi:galactitol-specific phosphotransferase system IIC component
LVLVMLTQVYMQVYCPSVTAKIFNKWSAMLYGMLVHGVSSLYAAFFSAFISASSPIRIDDVTIGQVGLVIYFNLLSMSFSNNTKIPATQQVLV